MCHVSCVTCLVSSVTSHLSHVMCHLSHVIFFVGPIGLFEIWRSAIGQSGGAVRWRVCYQRGLPRLVFIMFLCVFLITLKLTLTLDQGLKNSINYWSKLHVLFCQYGTLKGNIKLFLEGKFKYAIWFFFFRFSLLRWFHQGIVLVEEKKMTRFLCVAPCCSRGSLVHWESEENQFHPVLAMQADCPDDLCQ